MKKWTHKNGGLTKLHQIQTLSSNRLFDTYHIISVIGIHFHSILFMILYLLHNWYQLHWLINMQAKSMSIAVIPLGSYIILNCILSKVSTSSSLRLYMYIQIYYFEQKLFLHLTVQSQFIFQ